jgi:dihydroneopterin aldolase / 2-amino-4-hydroxy-6-hydroxymethyldihydropteridine diphosphokinase
VSDRIELTGLRLEIPIGVLESEHGRTQPVELDVFIECDVSDAARTDEVNDTIHYGVVLDEIEAVLTATHHELLERAAEVVAYTVLKHEAVTEVEICLRKLQPPVTQQLAHTAVRIRRRRSGVANFGLVPRHRAYVALGSNLGSRLQYLRRAVRELQSAQGSPVTTSAIYETEPFGGREGQGAYLNMVVAVDTTMDPYALLRECQRLEDLAVRVRAERNGPRTLDADVLAYEGTVITSEMLTIPHPRMFERRFVLEPLLDIAPELVPHDWEQRVGPGAVTRTGLVL